MKISKRQLWEYFILVSRYWLAFILIFYSIAKLAGFQFYIDERLLITKVKDADLFKLSWFLADHEPFKAFIAVSQISAAVLLIFNRTAVIGAFLAIPIWLNILIWDISFMDRIMAVQFGFRISYYLVLTGLILWFYRNRIIIAYKSLSRNMGSGLQRSILLYISLPLIGYVLEFIIGKMVSVILTIIYRL